jgi:hypothetical protein
MNPWGEEDPHWRGEKTVVQINNALYGLPYAGRASEIKVRKLLNKNGYFECDHTPCLYRHESNGVTFVLATDDYLIKYETIEGARHLLAALEQEYNVKTDWDAKRYFGMNIEKSDGNFYLSMPNYVDAALKRFQFRTPSRPVNSPAKYEPPV